MASRCPPAAGCADAKAVTKAIELAPFYEARIDLKFWKEAAEP
jgi:hypothetical protein